MKSIIVLVVAGIFLQNAFSHDYGVNEHDTNIDIYEFVDQGEDSSKFMSDSDSLREHFTFPYTAASFHNVCYVVDGDEESSDCYKAYDQEIIKNPSWNVKSKFTSGSDVLYVFSKSFQTGAGISCKVSLKLEFQDFDGKLLRADEKLDTICSLK